MKNIIATLLLVLPCVSFASRSLPSAGAEPLRVEVWSRGLSARLELRPQGAHYEMTVRTNGGQSSWKQVHRQDAAALIARLTKLEKLMRADEGAHEIQSAGCRAGWVRMRPQRPNEWKTCLDQPRSAALSARRAVAFANDVAAGFEKLVKAPEAPIVLRQAAGRGAGASADEPESLITFTESEEDRLARVEAEVEAAEHFARRQLETERLRQQLITQDTGRDPFRRTGAGETIGPRAEAKAAAPRAAAKSAARTETEARITLRREAAGSSVPAPSRASARELKRLESLVQSVEKYVAETPALVDPQNLRKFVPSAVRKLAPTRKDLIAPGGARESQTAGPRAP